MTKRSVKGEILCMKFSFHGSVCYQLINLVNWTEKFFFFFNKIYISCNLICPVIFIYWPVHIYWYMNINYRLSSAIMFNKQALYHCICLHHETPSLADSLNKALTVPTCTHWYCILRFDQPDYIKPHSTPSVLSFPPWNTTYLFSIIFYSIKFKIFPIQMSLQVAVDYWCTSANQNAKILTIWVN